MASNWLQRSRFATGTLAVLWLDVPSDLNSGPMRVSLIQPSHPGVVTSADVCDRMDYWPEPDVSFVGLESDTSREANTLIVYAMYGQHRKMIRARRLTGTAIDWDIEVAKLEESLCYPSVVGDGSGGAWLGWVDALNPNVGRRVIVHHLRADGTPTVARFALGSGERDQEFAGLAADGRGGAFACWIEASMSRPMVHLQHVTSSGGRTAGWPPGGRVVATPQKAFNIHLIEDGRSGVYLVWQDWIKSDGEGVRALRILADGRKAPGWPREGLIVFVRPGISSQLEDVTGDGAGGFLVTVNTETETSRAVVCRVGPDGRRPPGWPASGLDASASGGDQMFSRVIGQKGGALIVWNQSRPDRLGTGMDICGARFLADGSRAPGWPGAGLVLCDTPGFKPGVVLGPGEDGGAILAYALGEWGHGADLYAQWVDASGHVGVRPR
jgi:hypothetical protein